MTGDPLLRINEHSYARLVLPRHAHAETTVSMVLAGYVQERVGEREELAGPLSIVVKPRDTEHANVFGDGVRMIQIVLSADAAHRLEPVAASFRVWRWVQPGSAVPAFLRLLRGQRRLRAGAAGIDDVENLAYETLAALDAGWGTATVGEPPRWLATIRDAIDDGERASVRRLAADADVHPVYLARQFRRWYGCAITEYRSRRRLQQAAAAIGMPDRTLAQIAHDAGFADQPHMCRAFARATGMTPGAYRELLRIQVPDRA